MLLGAVGFVLAIGHYDVGAYLWLEGAFVFGTILLLVVCSSPAPRARCSRGCARCSCALRIERPLRAFYDGVHHYRGHPRLLLKVFVFTTAIQAVRILSIWASCKAVGIELGPRIYYVMGPLFFLVLLVPFTLNGFAVREAFFVSFLGSVGVDADEAFAAGFLFFLVTVALAAAGRRDPALGVGPRWRPAARSGMADAAVVVSSPTTRCRGSSSASRASRASRRSSSTTARPTAPSRSSASASRRSRCSSRRTAASRPGWNAGLAEMSPAAGCSILNADAWLVGRRARRGSSPFGDAHPTSPSSAPKLLNPDGSLQRSVRGFPTRWRLATEYLYLRKLGPRSRL